MKIAVIMQPLLFWTGTDRAVAAAAGEGSSLSHLECRGAATQLIVDGRLFPLVRIQGWIADRYGLQLSFSLTALCKLNVLFYALWGAKPTRALADEVPRHSPDESQS